ncbi:MAG: helix-turn-helix domain-containing protein [Tepidisphaeraceae bacterium]
MAVATKSIATRGMTKYLALVKRFPLRPIRTARELDAATAILDRMFGAAGLSREEDDYVQVLAGLVEKYEDEHDPVDLSNVTPAELLRHLMDENDMKSADLAELLEVGASAVSMILSGKREISKANAKRLAERFKADVSLFL